MPCVLAMSYVKIITKPWNLSLNQFNLVKRTVYKNSYCDVAPYTSNVLGSRRFAGLAICSFSGTKLIEGLLKYLKTLRMFSQQVNGLQKKWINTRKKPQITLFLSLRTLAMSWTTGFRDTFWCFFCNGLSVPACCTYWR